MKVKCLGRDFEVRECTYKQRRELHSANAEAYWNGKMDVAKYYKLLERVSDIAGLDEKELNEMEMLQVDKLLQKIFMEYLGLSDKKKSAP